MFVALVKEMSKMPEMKWGEEKKKFKTTKANETSDFFSSPLTLRTIQIDHRFVRVSSFGFSLQSAILYCIWTMLCEFANCVSVTIYLVLCLLYYSLASSTQFILIVTVKIENVSERTSLQICINRFQYCYGFDSISRSVMRACHIMLSLVVQLTE